MTFTISPAIKQCWPETALGLLLYQVQVAPAPQLLAQFDQTVASLASSIPWTPSPSTPTSPPPARPTRLWGPPPRTPERGGGHAPAGGEAGGPLPHQQCGGGEQT